MDSSQGPSSPAVEQAPRQQQTQSLPPITSITALTNDHAPSEPSPLPHHSISSDPRDSGNWSQSKRKVVSCIDLHEANLVQTLLEYLPVVSDFNQFSTRQTRRREIPCQKRPIPTKGAYMWVNLASHVDHL
jgi:hypothetical protein